MFTRQVTDAKDVGLSGSANLQPALLGCTGEQCETEPSARVSFGFGMSRTYSSDFSYLEQRDEAQSVQHNGSGHTSPVISECSSCSGCSEAATDVRDSTCLPEGELSPEEEAAKADARLRAACRIFNASAGRDGGCFDLRAAYGAAAILRLSSGSVLITRSAAALLISSARKCKH